VREGLALLVAFLCGSIPFGLLLVRLTSGVDVRRIGSGNIGATNALRAGGRGVGLAVLLLDALKGVAGVVAGRALLPAPADPLAAALLVLAPVAGHVFTPWLGFRGGKGVATALGVLAVADPRVLAVALGAFVLVALPTRIVSAGSVAAALGAAAGAFALHGATPLAWGSAGIALVVLSRHRGNIRRILSGTEPRLGRGQGQGGGGSPAGPDAPPARS
jgi:glycerol-3-phosphate acyltransferase PlsY